MKPRVVLAYSGGLDTTVAVDWLGRERGFEVVAVAADVGQGGMEEVRERALQAGAVESVVASVAGEFASAYVGPALRANALYQQKYPLVSALSRPIICKHLVAAARELKATHVAHGCTGKGNDQVRFEVSLAALAPDLEVLAPVREWSMTREESIAYGVRHGLPVNTGPSGPYSIDENFWGRTIECGDLEDPMTEPPGDIWERTADPADAPKTPRYVEIGFEMGMPTSLDSEKQDFMSLTRSLDGMAGAYGFGRVDMIEDRVVGIKSREIYETPGALALIAAHTDLEELTSDREVLRTKRLLEHRYAQLVYEGQWFSPLREALDAFVDKTQEPVTGTVRMRLDPGTARVVGRESPASLYDMSLATYAEGDSFDHASARGFVRLWGLPLKTWARARERRGGRG